MGTIEEILRDYDEREQLFAECSRKLSSLIAELLQGEERRIHSITARVKSRDSLRGKLERPDASYQKLADLTDIVGIRIITYFDEDVDEIAQHISSEFELDTTNSTDKRKLLDSDRFGYLSLHHIASFASNRNRLREYRRFAGIRFEIQIRSILQHAWAEIEHDLGYKSKQALPRDIWRRFFRLAGLLEIADVEFSRIRNDLHAYETSVEEVVRKAVEPIPIDQATLLHFVRTNAVARDLDRRTADYAAALLDFNESFFGNLPIYLEFLGIGSLGDLSDELVRYRNGIAALAERYYEESKRDTLSAGVCILNLCYMIALGQGGKKRLIEFMDRFSIAKLPEDREYFTSLVLSAAGETMSLHGQKVNV